MAEPEGLLKNTTSLLNNRFIHRFYLCNRAIKTVKTDGSTKFFTLLKRSVNENREYCRAITDVLSPYEIHFLMRVEFKTPGF